MTVSAWLHSFHYDMVEGTWNVYSRLAGHVGKLSNRRRRWQIDISWMPPILHRSPLIVTGFGKKRYTVADGC
jgi:hypothetical protein